MDTYIFNIDNNGKEIIIAVKEASIWAARTEVSKIMPPSSKIIGYVVIGATEGEGNA